MGVTYTYLYPEVGQERPVVPPPLRLEQPRPDLERQEQLISQHRRSDLQADVPTVPRSMIEPLLRSDELVLTGDKLAVDCRERARLLEAMDAPVAPARSP